MITADESIRAAAKSLREKFDTSEYSLATVFDLAVLVAAADGTVDAQEMEVLGRTVRDLLGAELTEDELRGMIQGGVDLMNALGVEARTELLAQILKERRASEEALLVMASVAYASEGLAPSERKILEQVATLAGVSDARLGEILASVAA